MKKVFIKAFVFSLLTYLCFFHPHLNPSRTMYSGSDTTKLHYPKRFYLFEKLREGEFPFWTERIFSGFPIYADVESGYLHPLNIITTYLFGPIFSYKLLHFGFYCLGSMSLYLFLKKKGFDLFGYFVANLIYFFTFFHLYHQQHFNMVWATYLFPTILLLADLYIDTKKLLYLVLEVLVFANIFYLGSLQMFFLFGLVSFIYFLVFAWGKFNLRESLFCSFFSIWLFLILVLPLLIPALELYGQSVRQGDSAIHLQGSFMPVNFATLVYPYLFNWGEAYEGVSIYQEYFKHETYVYVGISGFLIALVSFVSKKKEKVDRFLQLLVLVFILLAFAKFIPLFNRLSLPGISLFRYWGRSVVLFGFVIAFYVGYFVSHFGEKKVFHKASLFKVGGLFAFLGMCQYIYWKDWAFIQLIRHLKRSVLSHTFFDGMFWVWVLVTFLSLGVLLLTFLFKKVWVKYLLCLVIFADVFFFGWNVLRHSFVHSFQILPTSLISSEFDNKRVAFFDDRMHTNRGLFYKSWSLFGYSQFAPKRYTDFMLGLGFKGVKSINRQESFTVLDIKANLQELGVDVPTFPFKNVDPTVTLTVEEGLLRTHFISVEDVFVDTFIKDYPGWELYIDGVKTPLANSSEDLFLSFTVPKGSHSVELWFVPRAFYKGLFYSGLLLVGLVIMYPLSKVVPKLSIVKSGSSLRGRLVKK